MIVTARTEIEIAPGVHGRREHTETYRLPDGNVDVVCSIRYDDRLGQYACVRYALALRDNPGDDSTIRSGAASTVCASGVFGVEDSARRTAWSAITEQPNKCGADPWGIDVPADVIAQRGGTERRLMWVAQCYRIGYALDAAPTKFVASQLGISSATASRLVDTARRLGSITIPARHSRAGALVADNIRRSPR